MRHAARLTIALAATLAATASWADDYPSKMLRMVVPYPPGGITDKIAREVSEELSKRLKQTVVVENRAGAAGNIGFDYAARQPADGYTLVLAPASNLTVQPALFKRLSYNLEKDFAPVSLLVNTPQVLLVHPSLPVNSVKELVEYSKKNPGKTNFGVTLGAYSHLAGEMLATQTGADFKAVPYQGVAPALNDLLGGTTQFGFNEVTTAIPQIAGNKIKPLAVAYRSRVPWLPNVPTMAEAGFPNFEVTSWYAVVTRQGTPRPIIDRLSKEFHDIVQSPDFKKRYDDMGAFVVGSTPEELDQHIKSETARWIPVVKQAGIEPN
ncbi:tripartite tricarboxylate transporter substrate binding protein [Pigmentiphaga sp.]|uniref:Bug family tripartite tricarboxylate transporter substrate binding protein n=1 Tax=Pigmentiphaga sp. TaxID=1977564 RepID=UPI00128E186B|nr:tripartite tricarboxylate transporter substrate binding protein [Pigmentiphaga sp.]MPS27395.1 tripartite tricarboxylate transporter substrate binding protein [Alcaligenaceae bacterium SAGV5]MPS50544.1 tripartite tricarboxylate transporter substrate binding protein [Alcaligenaceae bacterium SAGV3]MPT59657.1 tripartite tricarboxylate transporter substrate binding protein [Alcaligenaceae bacterium]